MNLNSLAAGAVGVVNPQVPITVLQSTGYTTNADGTQVPTTNAITTTGQIQPLGPQQLRQMEGLNIQNVNAKVYLNGDFEGVFRVLGKGGDLLQINGQTYLVTIVLERWKDWTLVGVTLQD